MGDLDGLIKGGKRKIRKAGDSLNVSLPPVFLNTVGLTKGDSVEIMYNSKMLVIIPVAKREGIF